MGKGRDTIALSSISRYIRSLYRVSCFPMRAPPRVASFLVGTIASLTAARACAHGFGQRFDLPLPLWLWILVNQLTFLGSVRDACAPVLPTATSLQFEGSGTYNGAPATFRGCVQDNRQTGNPGLVSIACTAGCSYNSGGTVGFGTLVVTQN